MNAIIIVNAEYFLFNRDLKARKTKNRDGFMTIAHRFMTFSYRDMTISHRLLTIAYGFMTFSYRVMTIPHRFITISYRFMTIADVLLARVLGRIAVLDLFKAIDFEGINIKTITSLLRRCVYL